MEEVVRRLEKLERRVRVVKLSLVFCGLMFSALLVMGQAPSNRTLRAERILLTDAKGNVSMTLDGTGPTLRAQRIVLSVDGGSVAIDSEGLDVRTKTSAATYSSKGVIVFDRPDRNGVLQRSVEIDSTGLRFSTDTHSASYSPSVIRMRGPGGSAELSVAFNDAALLSLDAGQPSAGGVSSLSLSAHNGAAQILVAAAEKVQNNTPVGPRNAASIVANVNGPTVELNDRAGFLARMGVAELETLNTGETHRTSAASMVLFGKDKKVIWKAP